MYFLFVKITKIMKFYFELGDGQTLRYNFLVTLFEKGFYVRFCLKNRSFDIGRRYVTFFK